MFWCNPALWKGLWWQKWQLVNSGNSLDSNFLQLGKEKAVSSACVKIGCSLKVDHVVGDVVLSLF